jgi:hypothetical protein
MFFKSLILRSSPIVKKNDVNLIYEKRTFKNEIIEKKNYSQ